MREEHCYRMKKILLFSPTGYIGRFIKEKICNESNIQLYEITRDSDLNQYQDDYDIMIYSAATSYATADKYVTDNVVTAVSIVNFCRKCHIQRIIYLSSDSIYGEINTDVVTERAVMVNPGIYGITKYLAERIIIESGISYYILRMPGVVGRVWRSNFISNLMSRIKNNENIELYNIDRKFNNILDIDDLTQFIVTLCDCENKDQISEIFLLGNMETVELKKLVFYIKELHHSTSLISNFDTDKKRYFTLDITRAVEYGYSSKNIKKIIDELYQIQKAERNVT